MPEDALTCGVCGRTVSGDEVATARLTWVRSLEAGRPVWTCDTCSRTHLRSIEGKLDSAWW